MPVLSRRLFLVFAVVMALLASCSDLNSPVKEYLEEYSSSAAVGYQQILVPSEKDAAGIDSIASNADGVIRFILRNPRAYDIASNITLDDETIPLTIGTDYHLNLSADRQSISLTFTDEFLRAHDGETSGNLSATLTMSDAYRTFPSWHFKLRSNTPPPAPYASRVMLEPESEPGDRYVLCFNLDLGNGVQDDISSITVNGTVFTVAGVQAGGTQSITFAPADPRMSTTPPAGGLRPVGDLLPFVAETGMTQVYFRTGIEASPLVESRFTITVRDALGLSRSAITTTKGEMLVQPVIRNRNNETPVSGALSLYPEADGTYQVVLDHTVTGTTLNWSIDGGATQTSSSLPYNLAIPADCTIKVWASKSGFVNSDPVTVNLHCVTNIYYVDPTNPNAADATDHGSQSRPFRTVTYAVTRFSEPEDEDNTVYLMGNITGKEAEDTSACVTIAPSGNLTCTIEGLGTNRTITDDDIDLCRGISIYASDMVHVTLRNLTITGCYDSSVGGGIYFSAISGSRLVLENCIVSNNQVDSRSATVQGGGIYFSGSELTIRGSEVRQNAILTDNGSSRGGGLCAIGVIGSPASVEIFSSTFFRNGCRSNNPGSGGGLYVENSVLLLSGIPTDTTDISENYANETNNPSAAGHGGGIHLVNGSGTMEANVIIRNNTSTTNPPMGTGGGIRIETTNAPRSFTMNGGQIIENWAGKFSESTPSYGGGIYAVGSGSATLTLNLNGGTISGNYATGYFNSGTNGTGYGGGVYASNAVAVYLRGTTITDNRASRDGIGYGGGICIGTSLPGFISAFTMTGGEISSNFASINGIGYGGGISIQPHQNTTTPNSVNLSQGSVYANIASQNGSGSGGGLYLAGYITATMSSPGPIPLNIENNSASITGEGNGGGIFGKGQTVARPLTLTMNGGTISGNTASADNNGQGGACFVDANASVAAEETSSVIIENNVACAAPDYQGFGGAFYVTTNGTVTWNAGTLRSNQANSRESSYSHGEAFRIDASNATVRLNAALGDNQGSTGYTISITLGSQLYLHPNFSLANRNNSIYRDGGGTIHCVDYLYTNEIPLIDARGLPGDPIVGTGSQANYYKFLIGDGTDACINAAGNYSPVSEYPAYDFMSFSSGLGSLPVGDTTYQCNYYGLTSSATTTTIPSGLHVRLIPQDDTSILPNGNSLFIIEGHLLVGNPARTTSINCSGIVPTRSAPLIQVFVGGSLVLRNVDVQNSYADQTTSASLIDTTNAIGLYEWIVLDDFTYTQTPTMSSGSASALDFGDGTICHFVSGHIWNFRPFNVEGVATIRASSSLLYLHPGPPGPPGIELENNKTIAGSSIGGDDLTTSLHNLGSYPTR